MRRWSRFSPSITYNFAQFTRRSAALQHKRRACAITFGVLKDYPDGGQLPATAREAWSLQIEGRRLMGLISRAIDKIVDPLPTWAKGILGLLVVIGFICGIIHEGFWFLLRVLFAPDF